MKCKPCWSRIDGVCYQIESSGIVRQAVSGDRVKMRHLKYGEPLPADQARRVRQETARKRRNIAARVRHAALTSIGMKRCRDGRYE